MALKSQGKELYPLEIPKIISEGVTIYDRNTRDKSYFYLAFITEGVRFITSDGSNFLVTDGGTLSVQE